MAPLNAKHVFVDKVRLFDNRPLNEYKVTDDSELEHELALIGFPYSVKLVSFKRERHFQTMSKWCPDMKWLAFSIGIIGTRTWVSFQSEADAVKYKLLMAD